MRLHRFLIDHPLSEVVEIRETELLHQWSNVLRIKEGDQLIVLDGKGNEADAVIESLSPTSAELRIQPSRIVIVEPLAFVRLYCSVLKRENFELVVQKTTEIGVKEIVPLVASRTVKTGLKMDRLLKIAREATEQSGRGIVPKIWEPVSFDHVRKEPALLSVNTFFHVGNEENVSGSFDAQKEPQGIWIGPEGGWAEEEVLKAREYGFKMGSLGLLALRAETAAIIAVFTALHALRK